MPIFEFECNRCDRRFEELMRRTDPSPPCPECGTEDVRRLISNTSFQLKGTGWYVSDYPSTHRQGRGGDKSEERSESKTGDGGADQAGEKVKEGGAEGKGSAASSESKVDAGKGKEAATQKPPGNSVSAA